jgi:hypothetical protein
MSFTFSAFPWAAALPSPPKCSTHRSGAHVETFADSDQEPVVWPNWAVIHRFLGAVLQSAGMSNNSRSPSHD